MAEQNDISFFAKTNFRISDRIFGIKEDDRRRHMYVIGKSGMGKTNLLENLAIQDIKHGSGIAFVDPHGDSAEKHHQGDSGGPHQRRHLFQPVGPGIPDRVQRDGERRSRVPAPHRVGTHRRIQETLADSWGPRLEYILRNAILALLEYPGSTPLGVTRILVDSDYRENCRREDHGPGGTEFLGGRVHEVERPRASGSHLADPEQGRRVPHDLAHPQHHRSDHFVVRYPRRDGQPEDHHPQSLEGSRRRGCERAPRGDDDHEDPARGDGAGRHARG